MWCSGRDSDPGLRLERPLNRLDYTLNWRDNRADFIDYLESKRFNAWYAHDMLSYLDKNVTVIRGPMDLMRIFAKLTQGQAHHLNRGIRNLLNFMELKGVNPDYLNALRKAIPQDITGYDLNVPSESEIASSLRMLNAAPLRYQALYNLLLDSGLRLTEGIKLLNQLENAVPVNGFYRCTLGYFRGSKVAYAAYFTAPTLAFIQQNHEKLSDRTASHYYYKNGYVAPKHLRKFAFDTMISEALSIPESVADFIEGRVPTKIGAKHYAALLRQADGYYGHYADYITRVRASAL